MNIDSQPTEGAVCKHIIITFIHSHALHWNKCVWGRLIVHCKVDLIVNGHFKDPNSLIQNIAYRSLSLFYYLFLLCSLNMSWSLSQRSPTKPLGLNINFESKSSRNCNNYLPSTVHVEQSSFILLDKAIFYNWWYESWKCIF